MTHEEIDKTYATLRNRLDEQTALQHLTLWRAEASEVGLKDVTFNAYGALLYEGAHWWSQATDGFTRKQRECLLQIEGAVDEAWEHCLEGRAL